MAKQKRNKQLSREVLAYSAAQVEEPKASSSIFTWVCIYLLLIPAADLIIRNSLPAGMEIKADQSRFTVVNALTLTGFQLSVPLGSLPATAKVVLLLLTLGGTVFALAIGSMAVVRIAALPFRDGQVLLAAIGWTLAMSLIGAIPLMDRSLDFFPALLDALHLSACAFGNSGVHYSSVPGVTSLLTHLIILPWAIVGFLGLPVLMEIQAYFVARRPLSDYSRTVLAWAGWGYVALLVVFSAMLLAERFVDDAEDLAGVLASSSVAAINSRTLGMPFEHVQAFPRAMQWVLILAMMIGGNPGSAAGGLKLTTLVHLFRGGREALAGQTSGRAFGIALAWVGIYLAMVIVILLLLVMTAPQVPADRLLFDTISALSNVGLSHDAITIVTPALDILSLAMLMGRLAPLGILWWMAQTVRQQELPVG